MEVQRKIFSRRSVLPGNKKKRPNHRGFGLQMSGHLNRRSAATGPYYPGMKPLHIDLRYQ